MDFIWKRSQLAFKGKWHKFTKKQDGNMIDDNTALQNGNWINVQEEGQTDDVELYKDIYEFTNEL